MKTYLVTFFTVSDALLAERTAKEKGLEGRLIPVPREISTGCGICMKIETEDPQELLDALTEADVDIDACVAWEKKL